MPAILWHDHVGESSSCKSSAHGLLIKVIEDASAAADLYLVASGEIQHPRLQLLRVGVRSAQPCAH